MERKTDATKRGGGFLSNKLFETIRERKRERERVRRAATVSTAFVPPPPSCWPFPCYFNWADAPPVIQVSVSRFSFLKKKRAKRHARIFPPLCPFGG